MENITIKDVARLCGVGVSTVSRAMNNHPDINQETKEKIMKVIEEYNYVPNNSARNLKRSEAKTIAVLVKNIGNTFFTSMIQVLEEEIQAKKYTFVLQHVDEDQDEVQVALTLEKEKRLKGIIFLGGSVEDPKERLEKLSVPFVLTTIHLDREWTDYATVSVDDVLESRRIVEYLIGYGHRRIAVLCGSEDDTSISRLRLKGYRDALDAAGLDFDPSLVCYMETPDGAYSMLKGYDMMRELLGRTRDFTAVYAIADNMAIGACRALRESGMDIPGDCSVVGYDGLDCGKFYYPSLTTIRQPVEEMAEAAVKLLFDMIKKRSKARQLIFEAELVRGESVGPAPEP